LHAILNSLCILESVKNATNYFFFFHFHLKQHVSALDGHLQVSQYVETSEDNTTRYWREQQARGKLQIAEETKQWVNEYKK
jgi:hypothetical protein